jgi:hypothetical protein
MPVMNEETLSENGLIFGVKLRVQSSKEQKVYNLLDIKKIFSQILNEKYVNYLESKGIQEGDAKEDRFLYKKYKIMDNYEVIDTLMYKIVEEIVNDFEPIINVINKTLDSLDNS